MSKPDYIPQDVWDTASGVWLGISYPKNWESIVEFCAETILNEREKCAQVIDTLAEVIADEMKSADYEVGRRILATQRYALQSGAAAIRAMSD